MMDNVIADKSFQFAIRIVNLYKHLCASAKEYVMSKQLLRCGTSIGANVAEAQQAQSHADFIAKLSISLKETSETKYWLRLLNATDFIDEQIFQSFYADVVEIEKILVAILKSARDK